MTWSPEVRVLISPARTFRELAASPSGARTWLGRPAFLVLLLRASVSLQASGRTSARLVVDGAIAFAFVPIFMIAAMAIVYRRRPRRVNFGRALDVFFIGNVPAIMRGLDGAEICHPGVYIDATWQQQLEAFAARAPVAAIGSSDFHGLGSMGLCRTFVFATEASERGVLDAVRARRILVFGPGGQVYGDAALTQYADQLRPRLPASDSHGTALDWASRLTALSGFAGLLRV
jgi:hypothetical protein